ncbi:MAG TPA: hypothetical protein VIS06_04165, partial [Mycobacteriales bacterium]
MTVDLVVLVPSRGRPGNIRDLRKAWDATSTARSAFAVIVDEDDPCCEEYLADATSREEVFVSRGRRRRIGQLLNEVAPQVAGHARAVGFMGDDHRPRSRGWDTTMLHTLDAMGGGLVYGDDLIHGEALPTAVVMSSQIVSALGWMCPPGLGHLYLDNAWLELGRALGRIRYLPGLVVEHMHPIAGKARMDDTYRQANTAEQY